MERPEGHSSDPTTRIYEVENHRHTLLKLTISRLVPTALFRVYFLRSGLVVIGLVKPDCLTPKGRNNTGHQFPSLPSHSRSKGSCYITGFSEENTEMNRLRGARTLL